MIRRETDNGWLLITQDDHASLAYEIMVRWGNSSFEKFDPLREVLLAIKEHDCGWKEWDKRAWLNLLNRYPKNFMEMYANDQYKIWSKSFKDHCEEHPYASALIALHFSKFNNITLSKNPDSRTSLILKNKIDLFAPKMLTLSGRGEINGLITDEVKINLRYLQFGDIISLALCHGWSSTNIEEVPKNYSGGEDINFMLKSADGFNFNIEPNPFNSKSLNFSVEAKRLNQREYKHQQELDEEYSCAPVETIEFTING